MINSDLMIRIIEFWPKLWESLSESSIMLGFAALAAIAIGLPMGTMLYLTSPNHPLSYSRLGRMTNIIFNLIINVIRSFPFLLLVVAMQPLVREFYGRATGDPIAASFPMMVIASALYARFVEQSLLEIPNGVIELAESLGASLWQMVFRVLYVESRSSLIIGFTSAFVSFISYSTIMGVVGGGGIGDFAIRYGYQRYENDIMYFSILLIIIIVQLFQLFGLKLAAKLDKR